MYLLVRKSLIWLSILTFQPTIMNANIDEDFQNGNAAFQKGNFEKATEIYQSIAESGWQSSELYYNLGNAFYKNDQIGYAILNYEKAQLLAPRDAEIQTNLAIAQQAIQNKIEPIEPFFISKIWQSFRDFLSIKSWAILCLVFAWIGIGILIFNYFKKTPFIQPQWKSISWLFISFSILFLWMAFAKKSYENHYKKAIIIQKVAELKTAPESNAQNLFSISEGNTVVVVDQLGEFYKVELSDGDQGWLIKNDLAFIAN